MFKLANGWTKEKVMAQVKKYNTGKMAVRRDGLCAYEADDGNRCAVGCFIPDGHPGLDHIGPADDLLSKFPDLVPLMPFKAIDLCFFQSAHDLADTGSKVHGRIQRFLDEQVE